MMNLRSHLRLVAVGSLALFMIVLVAACGPSTYGQGTGTPGTDSSPATLPETGNQATGSPVTTTQTMTGTDVTGAPGAITGTQTITGTGPLTSTGETAAGYGTPGSDSARVEVVLKDYNLEMPTALPSGLTVFRVTNAGMEQHSLVIEGPGFEATLEMYLEPGETDEISVTLTAGEYVFYCPVDGHRNVGMESMVTVTQGK